MALTLGVRHGFDLDHLATIDAMTRTVRDNRILSQMTGFLFSLGHGLVVILMSLIISSGLMKPYVPDWLEGFGQAISLAFLTTFGLLNLYNIFYNPSSHTMSIGIKSLLIKTLGVKKLDPLLIMSIGALFAFSFDTFSQIALFSISSTLLSEWLFAGVLGFFFMLGMMVSDGINGLLVSALIQRVDRISITVSRILGLTISMFSLGLALMSLFEIYNLGFEFFYPLS